MEVKLLGHNPGWTRFFFLRLVTFLSGFSFIFIRKWSFRGPFFTFLEFRLLEALSVLDQKENLTISKTTLMIQKVDSREI